MKRAFLSTLILLTSVWFGTPQGMMNAITNQSAGALPIEPQSPSAPAATSNMVAVSAFGGVMQTFVIAGDYAYVSEGLSFVIFDITTPSNPVEVGRTLLPDMAWEIKIVGTHAYVADWGKGLQVVDISDPSAPDVVRSWQRETPRTLAYSVAIYNNYAYLGGVDNLVVLDVSDPTAPTYVKDISESFRAQEMLIEGNTLYIAGGSGGLVMYDLSDPSTPAFVSSFNPTGYGYTDGVALAGSYAYLADGQYGMRVVDISDPAAPSQVGKYPVQGYNHSGSFVKVALAGNFAYLADEEQGLWVLDITTPTAPDYHSHVEIPNGVVEVAFAHNHAFTANAQFKVFSAAAGTTPPALVGEYSPIDTINVLHAQDNVLLATARTGESLYRFDITDPAAPRRTATYNAFEGCEALQIEGHMAYVGGGSDPEDFQIFDLSIPGQLNYRGWLDTSSSVWRLSASGHLVFIGDWSNEVVVADASNPAAPVVLDTYSVNFVNDLAYGNGYVYVADGLGQILILDASDPANLKYVTAYDLTSNRVQVWGDYLVARGTQPRSFSIVDVSDPTTPALASTKYTSFDDITDIVIQDDLAYIVGSGGDSGSGLQVFDISNPTLPIYMAEYDLPVGARRVTVSGKYAYVGLDARGMLVIKLLLPRIASLAPDLGAAGWTTLVNIEGDGFDDEASVQFGTTNAVSVTVTSETQIEALAPATLAAGKYNVRVSNPSGYGHTIDEAFTVVDATADGVFASSRDLLASPAPPRATEAATLALRVHRVGGASALNDFSVDFYEGDPDRGGTLIGTGTIAALHPYSTATTSGVSWTPEYAIDTHIYAILGESSVKVHREIEVAPSSSDPHAPVINSLLINGGSRSHDTSSREVTLQISASDVGSGLNTMWVAEWLWDPGLGSWQVIQEKGWIPYQSTMTWTLSGSPGSHFINVWVADYAGNVSDEAAQAHINLLYPNMWIAQDQTQCFNYDLTAGQHVEARLTPASGDADLYVGTYDDGLLYSSYESGSAVESLTFDAPNTNWYSFIAHGYTNARYTLNINRSGSLQRLQEGMSKPLPMLNFPSEGPPTQLGLPAAPVARRNFPVYLPLVQR